MGQVRGIYSPVNKPMMTQTVKSKNFIKANIRRAALSKEKIRGPVLDSSGQPYEQDKKLNS